MHTLSFCNEPAEERERESGMLYFIVCFCLVAVTSSASLPSCALVGLWYANVAFPGQTHLLFLKDVSVKGVNNNIVHCFFRSEHLY